jgi:lipoprotein-anchoring transpeptidase ErfK/SrfK
VPRDALGDSHLVHTFLLIDRRALRLTLYAWGRPVFRAPVGVGKPATPTPAGRFWIREKYRVKPGTLYGVRAIGTSAYSRISDWPRGGVVGLHGTDKPQLIPGRPSHGCIRLRNRDVVRLYRLLPIGTPVRIR